MAAPSWAMVAYLFNPSEHNRKRSPGRASPRILSSSRLLPHPHGAGDGVGLRMLFRLVPVQLPRLDQGGHQRMIGRQHLHPAVAQAVKPAVPGPQRAEMAVGQHQRHHRRPHRGMARLQLRERWCGGPIAGPGGSGPAFRSPPCPAAARRCCRPPPAGIIAALMPAHAVGHHPDLLIGQDQNGILVDLAHPADMGLGVETDLIVRSSLMPRDVKQ